MMSGRVAVMAGPSLPPAARPSNPAFLWLPPARAGDVAALLDDPPQRLCLIDGLFESCPAPFHKELLLLMAKGMTVFGAASMGALRAAELDRHGMMGVGAIYAAYRDGRLTGDDEVALIHATERLDWAPLSVPLVEVRATLAGACRHRLLAADQARRIRAEVAGIHFADRDWPAIATLLVEKGLGDHETAAALERVHVPLKRQDALLCLDAALGELPEQPAPAEPPVTYFIMKLLERTKA